MKIPDMYFWQVDFDKEVKAKKRRNEKDLKCIFNNSDTFLCN